MLFGFETNLAKQEKEIADVKRKTERFEADNKTLEGKLLKSINQPGLIRAQPAIVENITKEDMEKKVNELMRENQEIERTIAEIRKKKDSKLFEVKMTHEKKGRMLMEQRAIKLALQYADPQDQEQIKMKSRIEELIRRTDRNDTSRKTHPNYLLINKKEKLEKELSILKINT